MNYYHKRRSIVSRLAVPFMVVVLCVGIFGLVWLRSQTISTEYRIGQLEREKIEALKEEKALYAQMASLLSIQEVARSDMDLEFPDRQRVVYVRRDTGDVPYKASLRRE
jgi:hypothetical protein